MQEETCIYYSFIYLTYLLINPNNQSQSYFQFHLIHITVIMSYLQAYHMSKYLWRPLFLHSFWIGTLMREFVPYFLLFSEDFTSREQHCCENLIAICCMEAGYWCGRISIATFPTHLKMTSIPSLQRTQTLRLLCGFIGSVLSNL